MRPVPVPVLPAEDAMLGGVQYTPKWDGIRALVFVGSGHEPVLVSRQGNRLNDRFPSLPPVLARLPVGLVLDGEVVAVGPGGWLDFTALLRTPAARKAAGTQVLYVAWDVLAVPGRDVRARPLRERWEALEMALAGARPPLQVTMATSSLAEARVWFRDLQPMGIEGIIAKGWSTPYRVTSGVGAWQKIRHTHTLDGVLLAVMGTPRRPHNLLVRLPDGRTAVTSPRLTSVQAGPIAELLADRLEPAGEGGPGWTITGPPVTVEVAVGTGRHATVRYIRLRPEE
ncbi:DNA ligase [Kitasatospora sp. NPDC090091]|uniref:ATP-dependent DNA ligase n=1 Tax=Kitasatospora sp. NPDC090091 TaxID=3364081 RepID=UPI0038104829